MLLCISWHELKALSLFLVEIILRDILNVYPFPNINNEEE